MRKTKQRIGPDSKRAGASHNHLLKAIGGRETVPEAIAHQLIQLIMDGKYKAGDRLPSEPELCRLFRVGRGAVREALKALAVTGMVRVERGRGTFVGKRSEFLVAPLRLGLRAGAELQSLIEARQLIEVELAGLAAKRAKRDDIHAMQCCLDRMAECTGAAQGNPFLEADVDFHFAIAQAAGNPILTQCMTLIRSLLHEWISVTWSKMGVTKNSLGEHRAIFEAVQHRDPTAARKAMLSHLAASKQRLMSVKRSEQADQTKAAG
jgi:GntR family transcriptional repressor for pyruvate dehydrogenase complex